MALTYNSYLKVRELISLQEPLAKPGAHDELLFIIIHQVYELWFKLINFELVSAIQKLMSGDILFGLKTFKRIDEIMRVLVHQLDVLETMTPVEFTQFRTNLNPASGFQSLQFREFELLAGSDPGQYEKFSQYDPEWRETLEERGSGPNLRKAFFAVLKNEKLIDAPNPESIEKAILKIYQSSGYGNLQALCEALIHFDEQVSLWRYRHVQMVERMIGMQPGTGGSLGVQYLTTTLRKRFFPELWSARTHLGKY